MSFAVITFCLLGLLLFLVKFEFVSSTWTGLSFDNPNFLCYQYPIFCENFLDEIGCGSGETDRLNIGCANETTWSYKGQCVCESPFYFDYSSTRIAHQLIVNRIAPDMTWMLEPFATGPPYDIALTYTVCFIYYYYFIIILFYYFYDHPSTTHTYTHTHTYAHKNKRSLNHTQKHHYSKPQPKPCIFLERLPKIINETWLPLE